MDEREEKRRKDEKRNVYQYEFMSTPNEIITLIQRISKRLLTHISSRYI